MLYRVRDIIGCAISANDGDIGHIKDVYFDDYTWDLRYYVVETGRWLHSQEVLLSTSALKLEHPPELTATTNLSRNQVRNSPPLASDLPVSRQYESSLHDYYGWNPYWAGAYYSGYGIYAYPMVDGLDYYPNSSESSECRDYRAALLSRRESGDPWLRSFKEVKGYSIKATDGDIGHIEDMFLDARSRRLSHFEVDTHNWIPGRHVVIDSGLVRSIDWLENEVVVNLSRAEVKASPPFDAASFIDENFQRAISSYYRWLTESGSKKKERIDHSEQHAT